MYDIRRILEICRAVRVAISNQVDKDRADSTRIPIGISAVTLARSLWREK